MDKLRADMDAIEDSIAQGDMSAAQVFTQMRQMVEAVSTQQPATAAQWLVWSNEHTAYWRPNSAGYTYSAAAAGRYSFDQAQAICRQASRRSMSDLPEEVPPEMMMLAPESLGAVSHAPPAPVALPAGFRAWMDAVVTVANDTGMDHDEVIRTWPHYTDEDRKMFANHPELRVGDVMELDALLAGAAPQVAVPEQRDYMIPAHFNADECRGFRTGYNHLRDLLAAGTAAPTEEQHPDDAAVDRFAAAMKAKLEAARIKGLGGWDNPDECTPAYLAAQLMVHLEKGNPGTFEDVANFAMMLHQRGDNPEVLRYAAEAWARAESSTASTQEQPSSNPCQLGDRVLVPEGHALVPVREFHVMSEDEDIIGEIGNDFEAGKYLLELAQEREPEKAWSLIAEIDQTKLDSAPTVPAGEPECCRSQPCKRPGTGPCDMPAAQQPVSDPDGLPGGLTFSALRAANAERIGSSKYRRCEEAWTPAHWMQATVGELGELANLLKKVDRGDFDLAEVLPDVRRELADVQTYLDILALKLGVDLGAATIDKFNEVSERIGSHVRLAPAPDEREMAAQALDSVAVELDTHLWRDAAIRVRGRAESIRNGTDAPSAIRRAISLRAGKGDE